MWTSPQAAAPFSRTSVAKMTPITLNLSSWFPAQSSWNWLIGLENRSWLQGTEDVREKAQVAVVALYQTMGSRADPKCR